MSVGGAEEVAVHTGDGRITRDAALHRRHALAAENRVVRQDRPEREEPRRPRRCDHVQDDGPVRGELDLARVDDAGHECLAADRRRPVREARQCDGSRTERRDDGFAKQDPGRE